MKKQYPYGTFYSLKVTADIHALEHIGAAVLGKWPRDLLRILIATSRGEINEFVARGLVGQIIATYAQQSFAECNKMWGFVYYRTPYPGVKIADPHEDDYVSVAIKDDEIYFVIHGLRGIRSAVREAAGYGDGVITLKATACPLVGLAESLPGSTAREIYESLKNCGEWCGSEPTWWTQQD